jgi:hypothetical protein
MKNIVWIYTAVQHTDHVAVHRVAYDGATAIGAAPQPETLTDVNAEHLFSFVAHVAVGLTSRAVISQADFMRLVAAYDAVCAAEQVVLVAEELAIA